MPSRSAKTPLVRDQLVRYYIDQEIARVARWRNASTKRDVRAVNLMTMDNYSARRWAVASLEAMGHYGQLRKGSHAAIPDSDWGIAQYLVGAHGAGYFGARYHNTARRRLGMPRG